ncbi:MAG: hypothetical protein JNL50_12385 [Phycisphaerae bacterium]|nr:hypothetical protein [Phycisphaerae bacterium]
MNDQRDDTNLDMTCGAGPVLAGRDPERGVRWMLSASAVLLVALLAWRAQAMQIGRGGDGGAGMVSAVGDYTMMTFPVGNEDMLLTLDNRSEELYVYRVENQNAVSLFQKLGLPRLFSEARTRAAGTSK